MLASQVHGHGFNPCCGIGNSTLVLCRKEHGLFTSGWSTSGWCPHMLGGNVIYLIVRWLTGSTHKQKVMGSICGMVIWNLINQFKNWLMQSLCKPAYFQLIRHHFTGALNHGTLAHTTGCHSPYMISTQLTAYYCWYMIGRKEYFGHDWCQWLQCSLNSNICMYVKGLHSTYKMFALWVVKWIFLLHVHSEMHSERYKENKRGWGIKEGHIWE